MGLEKVKKKSKKTVKDKKNKFSENFNITKIIGLAMKLPKVRIDRKKFLKAELSKYVSDEVVKKAISTSPMIAGVSDETISKIAKSVILREAISVTSIAALLALARGPAIAIALPVDVAQYYAYMLRTAQKLMYLYGYKQICKTTDEEELDKTTLDTLILCLGAMYGVHGANTALKAIANALSKGVSKRFVTKLVTKGALYPLVKSTIKWFNIKISKKICTSFFSIAIPFVGSIFGGIITCLTFKPCCDRLKLVLSDTMLSKKDYKVTKEEQELYDECI